MPESILMSRGKFLKKDSESIDEWQKRIKQNKDVFKKYKIYKDWKELFQKIKNKNIENKFLAIIKDNSFTHKKYFSIDKDIIKEIYLYYLSNSQLLLLLDKVINKDNKSDINLIKNFFNKFSGYYYKLIMNHIYNKRVSNKKLVGFLKLFSKKALTDILTKWIQEDFKNDNVLPRVNKALKSIDKCNINLNYFRAIKRYIDSGCLEEAEIKESKYHMKNLNEDEVIDILKNNINDFTYNLKIKNEDLAYYENIEKKIEVITTELGEKLSLF